MGYCVTLNNFLKFIRVSLDLKFFCQNVLMHVMGKKLIKEKPAAFGDVRIKRSQLFLGAVIVIGVLFSTVTSLLRFLYTLIATRMRFFGYFDLFTYWHLSRSKYDDKWLTLSKVFFSLPPMDIYDKLNIKHGFYLKSITDSLLLLRTKMIASSEIEQVITFFNCKARTTYIHIKRLSLT